LDRVTNSCHTHVGSRSRYQRQLKRLERGSSTVAGARTPIAEAEEEEEDEEEEAAAMAQRRLKGKRKRKRGEGRRKGGGEKSEL
jgi:hypothetical protein